jgi:hypothetical protein
MQQNKRNLEEDFGTFETFQSSHLMATYNEPPDECLKCYEAQREQQ